MAKEKCDPSAQRESLAKALEGYRPSPVPFDAVMEAEVAQFSDKTPIALVIRELAPLMEKLVSNGSISDSDRSEAAKDRIHSRVVASANRFRNEWIQRRKAFADEIASLNGGTRAEKLERLGVAEGVVTRPGIDFCFVRITGADGHEEKIYVPKGDWNGVFPSQAGARCCVRVTGTGDGHNCREGAFVPPAELERHGITL